MKAIALHIKDQLIEEAGRLLEVEAELIDRRQ
jgi:hypothetical protein